MPQIPSWIRAAEPAQYEAEGLRIGAEESAQRDTSARADAELALRQQQLEQQATAAAQKFQAQQGYQQFLAQGGDPIHAILKFGPAMGQGTDVAAAIRAQQMAQPKTFAPPTIQMQPGPNGTQIPILVHAGRASVIPRSAYTAPAPPEQFQETVRQISGRDVPGQVSTKTGRFFPFPAGEQAGAVTPQQRLLVATAEKKKAALQKVIGDEAQLLALAKKRAGKKTPTHADLEAVESDLQKQIDDLDSQISQATGGMKDTSSPRTTEPSGSGDDPLGLFTK